MEIDRFHKEKLDEFRIITESSPDAIFITDREVNALCRRLGEPIPYPSQESGPPGPAAAEPGP